MVLKFRVEIIVLDTLADKETGFLTKIEDFQQILWLKTRFLATRAIAN